jgi:hypothetical protein
MRDKINTMLMVTFWEISKEEIEEANAYLNGTLDKYEKERRKKDTFTLTPKGEDYWDSVVIYSRQLNKVCYLGYSELLDLKYEDKNYTIEYYGDFNMTEEVSNCGIDEVLHKENVNLDEIIKYVDYEFKHLSKNSIPFIECLIGFHMWGYQDYWGEYDCGTDYVGIVDYSSIKVIDNFYYDKEMDIKTLLDMRKI